MKKVPYYCRIKEGKEYYLLVPGAKSPDRNKYPVNHPIKAIVEEKLIGSWDGSHIGVTFKVKNNYSKGQHRVEQVVFLRFTYNKDWTLYDIS